MIKNWKKFNEELSDDDILKNVGAASKLMNVDREIEKDMRENHRKHPQLSGLKALWNLPEDTLNEILWAFHEQSESELTIGYACKYIDFMTAIADTNNPAEAWDLFCEEEDFFEGRENPFTETEEPDDE